MNPIFWDNPQDDFAFSLFDLDWDVFEAHIKGSVNRVPIIEETGIKSTVCGPESFTPDHKPLLGTPTLPPTSNKKPKCKRWRERDSDTTQRS